MAFFALRIPSELRSKLAADLAVLQKQWPKAHWVHPDDYHLTLRFMGGLGADACRQLESLVREQAPGFDPFSLQLDGLHLFPPKRDRGVLWIGLQQAPSPLLHLQQRLEQLVQTFGLEPEARSFTPHITICRFHAADRVHAEQALLQFSGHPWGRFRCDKYALMKRRSGAREGSAEPLYEALAQFGASL